MTLEAGKETSVLQARGSLGRPLSIASPEISRRLRLLMRLGLLFVLAPILIRLAIFTWRIPLPLVLQPVLLAFIAYLLWDRSFHMRLEIRGPLTWPVLRSILTIFAGVAATMTSWVLVMAPERFLSFPASAPRLWVFVMLFYPLVSVVPQELIYRTFFFHRYGPLFGGARWPAYLVNGALFGFAHIIFGSWVSIALTAILGVLLAWRYDRARSFWAVWLEHTLYGCMIFTIGLGHYFFTGISALG